MTDENEKTTTSTDEATLASDPRLPLSMFNTGIDEVATAWFKKPSAPESLRKPMLRRMAIEGFRVAEALLISPKVSFKVYGENVVLCRLIDLFGVSGVEKLLEEEAIDFILWRGDIFKWVDPPLGLMPLVPYTATDPAHSDPQASIELGLKGWSGKPWPALERLAKLAVKHVHVLDEHIPNAVVQAIHSAYQAGSLVSDGFNPSTPLERLSPAQRDSLCLLGARTLEGLLLVQRNYDLHESPETWGALVKVFSKIPTDTRLITTVEKILELEGLPNIPELILKRILPPQDIVQLRNSPATEEFRKWLWAQPNPRDTQAVASAYLSAITGKKTTDTTWFKAARVTSVSLVGSGLGAGAGLAVAGTPGMIIGGALGLATSLADTFGLERWFRGTNPRRFAEQEIRPRVASHLVNHKTRPET